MRSELDQARRRSDLVFRVMLAAAPIVLTGLIVAVKALTDLVYIKEKIARNEVAVGNLGQGKVDLEKFAGRTEWQLGILDDRLSKVEEQLDGLPDRIANRLQEQE